MSDYILELDEDQLKHISKALDFYARIQTGQLSELVNPYMVPLPDADYNEVETLLNDLKKQMFPALPEKAYYSIRSRQLQDEVRQMIDIYEVVRYQLITDEPDKNKLDDVDMEKLKPFNWSPEKALPKIKKLGD